MAVSTKAYDELWVPPDNQRKLVLCFDGTGNKFQGNESDTNVVKIFKMLEKEEGSQYHYYQPGIGTYRKGSAKSSAGGPSMLKKFRTSIDSALDEAVGASFVDHVIGGYEFVMRYYQPDDHIYIFGFSRGAYTARFLAEMISSIGVLSKGNEEMVEFAWDTYAKFQSVGGRFQLEDDPEARKVKGYMDDFRKTFCREKIRIHFLGLFDCVNSVGQFEIPLFRHSEPYIALPPARHIRHAISIHERRLKFKPALFTFDDPTYLKQNPKVWVDCKEMWFAGNHADVGGGWGFAKDRQSKDLSDHLLSDIPLNWMLQELKELPDCNLKFTTGEIEKVYEANEKWFHEDMPKTSTNYEKEKEAHQPHDMLAFNKGCSPIMTLTWWILEVLPFFTRLELENSKWVPRYWPPNNGAPRDIPNNAQLHPSVEQLVDAGVIERESIPKLGGDNQNFGISRWFSWFGKQTSAPTEETNGSGPSDDRTPLISKANGTSSTNDTNGH